MDAELISQIYDAAVNIFCGGIYVRAAWHPCGWDFISFDNLESHEDIYNYHITLDDISNGVYDEHPYEEMTILEIIKEVGKDYCFEISGTDNF